jgi:RNA-binding protein
MLSPAERKALKARAHKLDTVVTIGSKGLTAEVVKEIELALRAHELREQALSSICQTTGAHAVQAIGKLFVLYRKNDAAR